jgi:hypothetical protein
MVSLVVALAPRAVLAQLDAPLPDLEWDAPLECPTRQAFMGELERALGRARTRRVGHVRVAIVQNADTSWTAIVRTSADDASAERVLRAETCQTVASAAAVIAAVAIETPSQPTPAEAASPEAPSVASKPAAEVAHRAKPSDREEPPHAGIESQLAFGVAGIVDTATMPALDVGIEGTVAWAARVASLRLRLGVSGDLFGDEVTTAPGHAADGGTFSLASAGARACGTRLFGPVEVGPCVGGEVDVMRGTGTAQTSLEKNGVWSALDGSALASWSPGRRVGLNVRLDGVLPLARPSFVIAQQAGTGDIFVHRSAAVTFRAAVGIELRFF